MPQGKAPEHGGKVNLWLGWGNVRRTFGPARDGENGGVVGCGPRQARTDCVRADHGALHDGHLALLEEGRRFGQKLVLSIFVNPTQFGPKEDLERYPRDWKGDLALAKAAGVDAIFAPEVPEMYPEGFSSMVQVQGLQDGLCGAKRPGHFAGVCTVVTKLVNVVRPHFAIFGEKDFQQLAVVRRMVADLNLGLRCFRCPPFARIQAWPGRHGTGICPRTNVRARSPCITVLPRHKRPLKTVKRRCLPSLGRPRKN